VVPQEPEAPEQEAKPTDCEANCAHHRLVRLSWAKMLKRAFDLDLEHCPSGLTDLHHSQGRNPATRRRQPPRHADQLPTPRRSLISSDVEHARTAATSGAALMP